MLKLVTALGIGLIPCALFGYAVMHRFEKLKAPEIWRYIRSNRIKVLSVLAFSFGWPVVIYHLAFGGAGPYDPGYALALGLGVITMLAGVWWRNNERKEEEEKHLWGEGTGY